MKKSIKNESIFRIPNDLKLISLDFEMYILKEIYELGKLEFIS